MGLQGLEGNVHGGRSLAPMDLSPVGHWGLAGAQQLQPQLVLNFGQTLLAGGQGCPVARSLWTAQSAWSLRLGPACPAQGSG